MDKRKEKWTLEEHIALGNALRKVSIIALHNFCKGYTNKVEAARSADALAYKYIDKLKDKLDDIVFRDHRDEWLSEDDLNRVYYGGLDNAKTHRPPMPGVQKEHSPL